MNIGPKNGDHDPGIAETWEPWPRCPLRALPSNVHPGSRGGRRRLETKLAAGRRGTGEERRAVPGSEQGAGVLPLRHGSKGGCPVCLSGVSYPKNNDVASNPKLCDTGQWTVA